MSDTPDLSQLQANARRAWPDQVGDPPDIWTLVECLTNLVVSLRREPATALLLHFQGRGAALDSQIQRTEEQRWEVWSIKELRGFGLRTLDGRFTLAEVVQLAELHAGQAGLRLVALSGAV